MHLRVLNSLAKSIKLLNQRTGRRVCVELDELLILRPDVTKTINVSSACILCIKIKISTFEKLFFS